MGVCLFQTPTLGLSSQLWLCASIDNMHIKSTGCAHIDLLL